jgi:hypothetical protein
MPLLSKNEQRRRKRVAARNREELPFQLRAAEQPKKSQSSNNPNPKPQ